MFTSQSQPEQLFYKLNDALQSENIKWKFVPTESTVVSKKVDNFESLGDKTVHLYVLKDSQGKPVKEYVYNDRDGKPKKLIADGVKTTINVLDFKNTTSTAIAAWKVSFTSDADIAPENIINTGMTRQGNYYELVSVTANARISAGEVLNHKVIFSCPLVEGKVAIAYDFKLMSGGVEAPIKPSPTPTIPASKGKYNYAEALKLTLYGFTWQTSGKKPAWNTNPGRGDCFLDDGQRDAKRDLSGGVHDAGDCIKVVLPAFSNCLQYVFGGLYYKDAYVKTGNYDMLRNIVRWYSDWGIKCQEMSGERTVRLWQWVSENPTDHSTMLPPERQEAEYYRPRNLYRKAFAIGEGHESVGEEPPAIMAACFAMTYLMFKDEDSGYANELLRRAKSLFAFAESRRGKYQSHKVYASVSYGDEISLAATCLYLATGQGEYLTKAEKYFYAHINYPGWTWCVDNHSSIATFLLAYATKKQEYLTRCNGWIDSWVKGNNGVRAHASGSPLRSNADWGTVPQSASAYGLSIFAHDYLGLKNQAVLDQGLRILDYCLGDNSKGLSYLVGFGKNYPQSPHHRSLMNEGGQKRIGTGLWVAGEKQPGIHTYNDVNNDWIVNEAGGYNSAVSMLVSAIINHYQK